MILINWLCIQEKNKWKHLAKLDILDELREKRFWGSETDEWKPSVLNTIEETYELCDALMKDDKKDICKELGDVLLHVAFYAKIGSETGDFDIKDVQVTVFVRSWFSVILMFLAKWKPRLPRSDWKLGTVEDEGKGW